MLNLINNSLINCAVTNSSTVLSKTGVSNTRLARAFCAVRDAFGKFHTNNTKLVYSPVFKSGWQSSEEALFK